jgi:hypothetical protein
MVAILALLIGCGSTPDKLELSAAEVSISSKDGAAAPTATAKAGEAAVADAKIACAGEGVTIADGKVTVAKSGSFEVTCKVEGTEVSAKYTVKASIPATFALAPVTLTVGGNADVAVSWKDDAGADATAPASATVAFASSDDKIVKVNGTKLEGVAAGTAEITATAEGFEAQKLSVTVGAADATAAAAPAAGTAAAK